MFTQLHTASNMAVDSIQNGKKQFVKSCIKDGAISDAITAFVDAQTAYTKALIETNVKTSLALATEFSKSEQFKTFTKMPDMSGLFSTENFKKMWAVK